MTTQDQVMPADASYKVDQPEIVSAFNPIANSKAVPGPQKASVDDDESEDRTFFQRYRAAIIVIFLAVAAVVFVIKLTAGAGSTRRLEAPLILVSLPLPSPPPPAPTAPPEPRMEEQQTFQPEDKPQEEPPKPPDQPPIGTNIKGDGRDNGFGLSNSVGNGRGDGGTGSTRFGWYAGQVQSRVGEALRNNSRTRSAEMAVQVRIWPDATGRITRAQVSGSSGDPGIDAALKSEVLLGLQLREPPPADMPMPIVLRLTAKRPR